MSVPQNDRKIQYAPAAGTTVLPYDFKIFSNEGIAVDRVRNGIINTLIYAADYALNGIGVDAGGDITLVVPSLDGDEYTVYGVGEERTAEYSQNGPFYASAVNDDMDNAIQITQQLRRDVNSKIGLNVADVATNMTLPIAVNRANKFVAFDNVGNLVMADSTDITGIIDANFILKTPDADLPNAQALSTLNSGIIKNTTGTGSLSIASPGVDYFAPGGTDIPIVDGGTGASTASGARSNLGLQIGTDIQAHSNQLTTLGAFNTNGLVTQVAPGSFIASSITGGSGISVANGNGSTGIPTISANIYGLTEDVTPDGDTDYVMTYDVSELTNKKVLLNNLPGGGGGGGAPIDASYIVQTPSGTLTNEQSLSELDTGLLKNTTGSGVLETAIAGTDYYAPTGTDIAVADGGTGRSSHTAYAVLCGGTGTTTAQQSIASVGAAGQVLTSNGAGALPTFETLSTASGNSLVNPVTQASHGFAVGNVLKYAGGAYARAQANNDGNSEVIGIVSAVTDANNFVLQTSGYISNLSGLAAGATYFLSPTGAGTLTGTEPSTLGQISKPLLIATSSTAGYIFNMRGVAVASPSPSTSGKILQVVQVVKNDTFPTTSTSYIDITGMSASITPTYSTSKILVLADIKFNAGGNTSITQLVRNTTPLYFGNSGGAGQTQSSAMDRTNETSSVGGSIINYLDSPATTSTTTYKIQGATNAGTFYLNRSSSDGSGAGTRTASSLTLMEIGG